jgi:hypothetical protein
MSKPKNEHARNFRDAVARIEKLPRSERSAMSNRPSAPTPAPHPKPVQAKGS